MGVYIPYTRLPSAYQEVEYIQSSGTQYFIVGTSFSTNYKSVIDLEMSVIGGDYIPLGVHNDAGQRYGIDAYGGKFTVISGGGSWANTATEDTNRHLITIDKATATVDGTSYSISYVDYTYNKGIGVFGYHNTRTDGVNYRSSNKLYKLDIYDGNGTHIYDLVPCYRKSDTEIGMYDLINDVFYTNQGTGTFTKGSDVYMSELKNAYIGEYYHEYTISNIPTDDSNVYVNVTRSGKAIQSVKFNLTCSYIQNRNAFVFISSNASNTNRYGFTFRGDTTTVYGYTGSGIYIRGRLNNSSVESIFRKIPNGFSTSLPNVIEYTINKDGNCSLTCNGQTTSFTATSSELTMLQTIMNSSTMNVYSSQSGSIISGNKVDVKVTYS